MYRILLICIALYLPCLVAGMISIERSEICTDTNIFNLTVTLNTLDNKNQKLNMHTNVTIPLGRNVNVKTQLFLWINNKWIQVLTFNDRDFCHYISHTNSQALHDIQRKSGTRPGCPIQPGYYAIDEYEISNGNLSFDIVPKGKIRLLIQGFLVTTKQKVVCLEIIANNS